MSFYNMFNALIQIILGSDRSLRIGKMMCALRLRSLQRAFILRGRSHADKIITLFDL